MAYYLALISPTDSPIYEAHLNSSKPHNQIISSSTSTFPSWSSFPAFGHRDNPSSTTVNPQSSFNAPQVPAKDPFPPQLLGGTGTTSLSVPASSATTNRPQGVEKHVLQMIAFSSLDIIEDVMQGTGSLYLKNVDRFNEWNVSALAVPCVKLVILHDIKNEEGIRAFLMEVWESYVKISLNPFYTPTTQITSTLFDARVRASAKKHL